LSFLHIVSSPGSGHLESVMDTHRHLVEHHLKEDYIYEYLGSAWRVAQMDAW